MGARSVTTPQLPDSAIAAMTAHVRSHGALGVETGGLIIADAAGRPQAVACAGDTGITRRPGLFKMSGAALDQLFTVCEARAWNVVAMFHSHAVDAFLSTTDRELGLNIRGFTSIVIPEYANAPADPTSWAWFSFDGTRWRDDQPWQTVDATIRVLDFDEDGVREL